MARDELNPTKKVKSCKITNDPKCTCIKKLTKHCTTYLWVALQGALQRILLVLFPRLGTRALAKKMQLIRPTELVAAELSNSRVPQTHHPLVIISQPSSEPVITEPLRVIPQQRGPPLPKGWKAPIFEAPS